MSSSTQTTATPEKQQGSASPAVASAFSAGLVYIWGEALFRLAFTYNTNFNNAYMLWQGRVGDIAAMWLTISVVGFASYFLFRQVFFRSRTYVGTIAMWTIILVISAIIAPMIGEIGTPMGI